MELTMATLMREPTMETRTVTETLEVITELSTETVLYQLRCVSALQYETL